MTVHWFRRDLRLDDNHGLFRALIEHGNVLPLFIFDSNILERLEDRDDKRVNLIHQRLVELKIALEERGSSLHVEHGEPLEVWQRLVERYNVKAVTTNHDHEPYAQERDARVARFLASKGIAFRSFKDISIFERGEILKDDGLPYTVFTPYSRKWLARFEPDMADRYDSAQALVRLYPTPPLTLPSIEAIGFQSTGALSLPVRMDAGLLRDYEKLRDIPSAEGNSHASVALRFGLVSVRQLVTQARKHSATYLNELIWREFFMQILWHFPQYGKAFKPAYDNIVWSNDHHLFDAWREGRTGYPLVDAGMRELSATGLMHNRVRMVVASFLVKHLLIDWRWGEAWFARKLMDFELSSNNGNWQWAAGCGCDAAPYFRVFNPAKQQEKFDPLLTYVKQWVPELTAPNYARPIVVHEKARDRAIAAYKEALRERPVKAQKSNELFN